MLKSCLVPLRYSPVLQALAWIHNVAAMASMAINEWCSGKQWLGLDDSLP